MLKKIGIQRNSWGGFHRGFPKRLFFIQSTSYIELLEEHLTSGPCYRVTARISIKKAAERLISYHVYFNLIGSMDMSG